MVQEVLQGSVVMNQSNDTQNRIALYFDIVQEHSITLQSQITDNWLENNTVIGDHIANSPIVINMRGLTGELVYMPVHNITDRVEAFTSDRIGAEKFNKLGVIPALLPPVDNYTQLAKNAVNYVENSYNRYKKIIKRFSNPNEKQKKLKYIYQQLLDIRENKTALIVDTPFDNFDNVYVQTINLRQDEQKHIVDIELSLKQVYFTDTKTAEADKAVLDKYNNIQRANVENHGKVQGSNKSLAKYLKILG